MDIEELLKMEDIALEGKFAAGTAAYPDKRFEDFNNNCFLRRKDKNLVLLNLYSYLIKMTA